MSETIQVADVIPAPPRAVYDAWLDAEQHARFTGGHATSIAKVGGAFTAWDHYIEGAYLALEPDQRILMTWRTSEFPDNAPDSHVEVLLEAAPGGTRITLRHTDIPDGQGESYRQGWAEYYFEQLKAYFSAGAGE